MKRTRMCPRAIVMAATLIAGNPPGIAIADALIDALNVMAPNSWRRINVNEFRDVWTPVDQRPTLESPESNISSWSGAAWDSTRKDILIWGGDIGDEQGNEFYVFHTATGLWERGALPSAITRTGLISHAIDGIYNAPLSGESWDNVVYLPGVDRVAVIGVSREGITFQDLDGGPTGPYFWDPSKANPARVSGTTGSHVKPWAYPGVLGGQMWQNRDNFAADANMAATGITAHMRANGNDVVYFVGRFDHLWRYTVRDLNPANDTWERIGTRTANGGDGRGSGDIDPVRGVLVQTLSAQSFGFWDVNHAVDWLRNREIEVYPTVTSGTPPSDYTNFGMQYDPALEGFVLWDGGPDVWFLKPPVDLDPDDDGVKNEALGWTLSPLNPTGPGPTIPAKYTGVYGKWMYLPQERAYLGVIDSYSGDVFVYKPPLRVDAPFNGLRLRLGVSEVVGCKSLFGTVELPAPAASDQVVTLRDTLASATTPATVSIPAGSRYASFRITTSAVSSSQQGTVSASLDGATASQPLSLVPMGPQSLVFKPTSAVGGVLPAVTGTLKLQCRAGPDPITVDLASARPEAAYPVAASVVVPVGLQSVKFDVMTEQVFGKTSVAISATAGGITTSRALTVLPWAFVDPPTSLKFAGVVVGTRSEARNATLVNRGAGAFTVNEISVTGTGASWFAQTNDCPASLAPGASCTIGVTFSPLSTSSRSAKLSVATSATTTPLTVLLSGTGLPP